MRRMVRNVWLWMQRIAARSETDQRSLAEHVERRRRELVRRAAERIGSY